ncbi:hypothetical protein U27_01190 [Candidatus Vecturithrix granuli]|uniref:Outer membrane protein beta-barrel domain-containing protein n=1 Tax=Vecturithrix granuli TaxID=1499967 RepID=A0A081C9N5_VECG1|nr:hypothetical protein U27_01190 [Candidatus Vecturithrix granuli]
MKKSLLILLVIFLATPVWAQTRAPLRRYNNPTPPSQAVQPVIGTPATTDYAQRNAWNDEGELTNPRIYHGFLAAPVVKFTTVNDQFGIFGGGRLGWILNHDYTIGVGGYGLLNDIEGNELDSGVTPDLSVKYGGVEFEYAFEPAELIHFSVYTLVGMGNIEFDYANVDGDDNFFVVEPAVNVLLNVTEFFKVGLGVGYRLAAGVDLEGLEDGDLSGIVATLTFKFGVF